MASRDDYIYYARLAEQGERYEDMIKYMKTVSEVRRLHGNEIVQNSLVLSRLFKLIRKKSWENQARNFET